MIPDDATARRVFGRGGNARQCEHPGIDPARMSVDASQHDRMIAADGVEIRRRREDRRLEKSLIPAAAVDPRARRCRAHRVRDLCEDLILPEAAEIQPFELLAQAAQMRVRVGEARHADAGHVHAPRRLGRKPFHLARRSESDDAPVGDGERFDARMCRVECDELPAKDHARRRRLTP